MFESLKRLPDRWMPPPSTPLDAETRTRFRFGIQAWLITWPLAVLWTGISAAQGLWVGALMNGWMVLLGPCMLEGLRRTRRISPWFELSLGSALLLYGPGMLGQTPYDETNLFFSVCIPLIAGFLFGLREALKWTFATAAVSVGSLLLAHAGYTFDAVDPTPTVTKVGNIVSALAMTALFSARFHEIRREALERAEAASRAKSMFLASISHEIRTPMNGVLGMAEVMLLEAKDPATRAQLEVIQRSGQVLIALLNDVLEFTKLEAHRLELEEASFDLRTLCDDVEGLFRPLATEKGVAFAVELPEDLPRSRRGDPLRLRQVLANLVSNAVKFTQQGSVRLAVSEVPGGALRFEVRDTGPGIPRELAPRLFSAFEQGDVSTTRRFGGTGLGLALSRQLVDMMGGALAVDSELGRGSTFSFTLALPVSAPPLPTPGPSVEPLGARHRLLVVDDNAINLKVASALARKAGYDVDEVSSGPEAVRAVTSTDYVAVLMDCHMPEMDGFEATRLIRALPAPRGAVPVIAITAATGPEDLAACRACGMQEVLPKPISFEELTRALAAAPR